MSESNGFELSSLSVDEKQQATMVPIHPKTHQELEAGGEKVKLILAGPDSEAYKQSERKATNRRLKQVSRGKKLRITAEELEAEALNSLIECTLGWENIEWEGEALECTPKNARMLYKELPWLREQAEEFIDDRSNFLGN